jgi:general secretion pathway protein K
MTAPAKQAQRGIALVTAIFVVAVAAIAAAAMFEAANIAMHRGANLAQSEAEGWYAVGVESWVKNILVADAKLNKTDSFADIWARPVDFLPIDGGGIRGQVVDLQGRFNLNNIGIGQLTNANSNTAVSGPAVYIQQFDRLLDSLPDFDGSKYHGMGYAIRDWIDADDQRSGTEGAEDQDYQGQDPPYRAANQPMTSVSELMLVRGMTKELYTALQPYVAALPSKIATPLNVNTAPEPVLMSLATNIDRAALQKFIVARKSEPLTEVSAISTGPNAFLPNLPTGAAKPALGVTSQFFEVQAEVYIGSGRLALYSVIYRGSSGAPVVLSHSTNTE